MILLSLSLIMVGANTVSAEDEVTVIRGDTITITVTLLQNGTYGYPVPDQLIFFFDQTLNANLGSNRTDANGITSIAWAIPSDYPLGQTIINATFYGNESLSLASSCQWIILTVLSSTDIEINQTPDLLAPGDNLTFTAHLTDDLDNPCSNATLTVFKDNTPLSTRITDSLGIIIFEIECNSSWITLGTNEIRVVHEQDLTNFLGESEYTFTVEIAKISTSLALQEPHQEEIQLGESIGLFIELSDGNNSLTDELLSVFLDDVYLLNIVSNQSGIAHLHMSIDDHFTLGFHVLEIYYNGSERYSESYTQTTISVTSLVQILLETPDSPTIGLDIDIQITVSDSLGRAIPNSMLLISDITSNQIFTIPSSSSEATITFGYELQGPPGIHTLRVEIINNPFISNASSSTVFSAWSSPEILLLNCNVEHYAWPNQEITFEFQMKDWSGNCTFKMLQLLLDDTVQFSTTTDNDGLVTLSFSAPSSENQYNISIIYSGNITLFEIATKFDYNLQVTRTIPVRLELDFYQVVVPLRKLSVQLTIRSLNGSTPQGIHVDFNWLDSTISAISTEGGKIVIQLRVPVLDGNYILYYESESSNSIGSTRGSFSILLTHSDISSLEGVGITGLTVALIVSVGISAVPIIRRRYLVG